ncbi:hypothetical protein KAFR_0E00460 [Kazachstania africana CBS 2517]|uniref:Vps72/YL1 C-terminal domain-containing protein n=1 Tax=Kazachstania africana (strain ATCC 22294 / BCRC 22015 / CBS 2517 / CECT 1963 / NBRC 1671 / NRRL Y-8276) TaxID=1071382 RepID=H2AV00_KAZAF|nr:hypothetical protein KAFR_0E00460 [Kazachstania africana CBS 2517]CCF58200.1 hypothetical protein KAFR_0E00460 [Kazachstania africana CBS 2517]
MAIPPGRNTAASDQRLEFLRKVAELNHVNTPLKKLHYKKVNKRHKSVKQLLSDENKRINAVLSSEVKPKVNVTYFTLNAPPSLRPAKKYCDITGLKGNYKSPTNNLRYHNSEIYQAVIKPMPSGIDQEYLKLRGANFVLK